jgi:hypothetical protein
MMSEFDMEIILWQLPHMIAQITNYLTNAPITNTSLGRGHTKETTNRNTTAISENCYQPELNTCY